MVKLHSTVGEGGRATQLVTLHQENKKGDWKIAFYEVYTYCIATFDETLTSWGKVSTYI